MDWIVETISSRPKPSAAPPFDSRPGGREPVRTSERRTEGILVVGGFRFPVTDAYDTIMV